jgi:hypothetical protein
MRGESAHGCTSKVFSALYLQTAVSGSHPDFHPGTIAKYKRVAKFPQTKLINMYILVG